MQQVGTCLNLLSDMLPDMVIHECATYSAELHRSHRHSPAIHSFGRQGADDASSSHGAHIDNVSLIIAGMAAYRGCSNSTICSTWVRHQRRPPDPLADPLHSSGGHPRHQPVATRYKLTGVTSLAFFFRRPYASVALPSSVDGSLAFSPPVLRFASGAPETFFSMLAIFSGLRGFSYALFRVFSLFIILSSLTLAF